MRGGQAPGMPGPPGEGSSYGQKMAELTLIALG
jgi:hypothetical protein